MAKFGDADARRRAKTTAASNRTSFAPNVHDEADVEQTLELPALSSVADFAADDTSEFDAIAPLDPDGDFDWEQWDGWAPEDDANDRANDGVEADEPSFRDRFESRPPLMPYRVDPESNERPETADGHQPHPGGLGHQQGADWQRDQHGVQQQSLTRLFFSSLRSDARKYTGLLANQAARSLDAALPGRQLQIRLGLARQRLDNAYRNLNAARGLPFDDPNRDRLIAEAEAEVREAEREHRAAQAAMDQFAVDRAADDTPGYMAEGPSRRGPAPQGPRGGALNPQGTPLPVAADHPDATAHLAAAVSVTAAELREGDITEAVHESGEARYAMVAFPPDEIEGPPDKPRRFLVTLVFDDGTFTEQVYGERSRLSIWPEDDDDANQPPTSSAAAPSGGSNQSRHRPPAIVGPAGMGTSGEDTDLTSEQEAALVDAESRLRAQVAASSVLRDIATADLSRNGSAPLMASALGRGDVIDLPDGPGTYRPARILDEPTIAANGDVLLRLQTPDGRETVHVVDGRLDLNVRSLGPDEEPTASS